jgi:putative endonuclease
MSFGNRILGRFDRIRQAVRRRREPATQAAGREGEDLAHRYLRERGFTIVARNFRRFNGKGEIDLIAQEDEVTVFVEVKTRQTDAYGSLERQLDTDKAMLLSRAAAEYLRRARQMETPVRFDLITVVLSKPPKIEHTRDAFYVG